jgi:hypothetical protein
LNVTVLRTSAAAFLVWVLPNKLKTSSIDLQFWFGIILLALAEAFYSQIPIVISADRPQSKIDIGDGQTIRQENVFANHSFYNANLNEMVCVENDTKIKEAIDISIAQKVLYISMPL